MSGRRKPRTLQDMVGAEFRKVDEANVCRWVCQFAGIPECGTWATTGIAADSRNAQAPWMLSDVLLLPWKVPITRHIFHPEKSPPDILGDIAYEVGSVFLAQDSELVAADALWFVTAEYAGERDNAAGYIVTVASAPRMLINTITIGGRPMVFTAVQALSVVRPAPHD